MISRGTAVSLSFQRKPVCYINIFCLPRYSQYNTLEKKILRIILWPVMGHEQRSKILYRLYSEIHWNAKKHYISYYLNLNFICIYALFFFFLYTITHPFAVHPLSSILNSLNSDSTYVCICIPV